MVAMPGSGGCRTYGYHGEMPPEELRADLLVESLEALL